MSFKLNYNLEQNNKECNPKQFYSRFGGTKYIDTLPKARRNIDYYFNPKKQVRATNQDADNVDVIKKSLLLKNYDHTKRPQCADVEKVDGMPHDGTVGFNRNTVYDILNTTLTPLDLVEYNSPADKWRHKGQSNTEPEHGKDAAAMSEASIQEHIKDGVREGFIVSDKEIKEEIEAMSVTRDGLFLIGDDAQKRIFKEVKKNHPKYEKLQTYNNDIAGLACEQLGLPHGGFHQGTGKVGYFISHTVGKDAVWNTTFQNSEHFGLEVGLTLYLPTPPQKRNETITKRVNILESIPKGFDKVALRMADMFDIDIAESRVKMINNMNIKVYGFLNSYVDEVPEKHPYEYCLVDLNGNYIKNPIASNILPTKKWWPSTLENFIKSD